MIDDFRKSGGEGKPAYGQVHICWDESEFIELLQAEGLPEVRGG